MNLGHILVSLLPVIFFLIALVFLDSYKLIKLRSNLQTILIGAAAAAASLWINSAFLRLTAWDISFYSRYPGPAVEEFLKAVYPAYLLKSKKVGFMVDAAIYGFAVGTGFALVENVYYLQSLADANLLLWIIRGFGTAVMHGGTTAIFAIVAKNLFDRHASDKPAVFLPAVVLAIAVHSSFNHFVLSPLISTISLLIALPLLIILVFHESEKSTRHWLGVGFDTDMEVLELITTGNLSETKTGTYLQSLKSRFSGEIVADMLCLLRIHVELSMRAKGILLMREAGWGLTVDPEIREKFAELNYLRKSIGKTGQLAIAPFLHKTSRDLWQLYMLGKN